MTEKKLKLATEDLLLRWLAVIMGVGLVQQLQNWPPTWAPLFERFNRELVAVFLFLSTLFLCYWPHKKKTFTAVLIFFGILLAFSLGHYYHWLPYPSANGDAAGLALIYLPVLFLLARYPTELNFFETSFSQVGRSLLWFVLLSLIVFPALIFFNHYFQDWVFHRHYRGPKVLGLEIIFLKYLFFVALPEEFFFRGYLQEKFNQHWGRPFKFWGASFGHGLWVTSLLFAASHSLLVLEWWHFAIFFPGMAFGWLKEKTGSITAPTLFHAAANTFATWVTWNY